MEWTEDLPTAEGWYLWGVVGNSSMTLVRVGYGDWRQSRNPAQLYGHFDSSAKELASMTLGLWYGPLSLPTHPPEVPA